MTTQAKKPEDLFNLSGRVALVTGASRGIGRATALLAAAQGWTVGVNYREDRAAADAVVAQIQAAGGQAVHSPGGSKLTRRVSTRIRRGPCADARGPHVWCGAWPRPHGLRAAPRGCVAADPEDDRSCPC